MQSKLKHYYEPYITQFLMILLAIPIGAIIGFADTIFGRTLLAISEFRDKHFFPLILFLSLAGVLIVYCYNKFGDKASKGMGLIFEVEQGEENNIPLRLVPFVIVSTWITHLFGGSAGREGVAVQIGATISYNISKYIKIKDFSKVFLVVGMSAGFAGLFRTPIAAVFFAIEVLVAGELRYKALLPAITSAIVSSEFSKFLGLEKFSFNLSNSIDLNFENIIKLALLGVIFGIVGLIFSSLLKHMKKILADKIPNNIIRIFIAAIILTISLLAIRYGRYSGLGTNLINLSFSGDKIYISDFLLKLIFTVITLSAGFQGGEVTPLFSIGASLGAVLAGLIGLPVPFVSALGYVAVFGSATNTLLAPIFIGAEVFGYSYMPYFVIVCSIAYTFNMNSSIYGKQKINQFIK